MISNEGHDILVEDFEMSVLNIPMNVASANDKLETSSDVQQLLKAQQKTIHSVQRVRLLFTLLCVLYRSK